MGLFGKKEAEITMVSEPVAEVKAPVISGFEPAHKTTIGSGVEFTGDFSGSDPIEVSGKLNGKVDTDNQLTVAKDGQYEGDAEVKKIHILGAVDGDIDCQEAVIANSGKMSGSLKTEIFLTEAGCDFDGTLKIKPSATVAASAPAEMPDLSEEGDIPVTEEDLFS